MGNFQVLGGGGLGEKGKNSLIFLNPKFKDLFNPVVKGAVVSIFFGTVVHQSTVLDGRDASRVRRNATRRMVAAR